MSGANHDWGQEMLVQMIDVFQDAVFQGGTVVMKLSRPERLVSAQLIWMFDNLAADVRTWKPVCIHATRGTFYLIARGMGFGAKAEMYDQVLTGLRDLWENLTLTSRRLQESDLNFIVQKSVLQGSYAVRLRALSAHIWEVQEAAWKGWRQQVANGF